MTLFTHQRAVKNKHIHYAIIALVIAGLLALGWVGFTWYKQSQEKAAYKELAQALDAYAKVRTSFATPQKWADVDHAFEIGAQRHTSSKLYPFFLTYRADALIEQGRSKDALTLMEKALTHFDKTQPLYYVYAMKTALMKIDSADPAVQKQGKEMLEALSKESSNPVRSLAAEKLNPSQSDTVSKGELPF